MYPRKVGKDAARRVWRQLAPDTDLTDRMVAAVEQQRASAQWQKDGGEFIPYPRTWLHQRRWEDEGLPPDRGHVDEHPKSRTVGNKAAITRALKAWEGQG